MSKICVLGQGYISLPTALLFANSDHEVVGIDVNKLIVDVLKAGKMLFEDGFQELLDGVIVKKAYRVESLLEEYGIFPISFPTPFDSEMSMSDIRYVASACETIVPHLKKDNLVIIESTIPPNSCNKQLGYILEKSGLKAYEDFYLYSVTGGTDERSTQLTSDLYSSFVRGNFHLVTSVLSII